jgi:hypothetical protein
MAIWVSPSLSNSFPPWGRLRWPETEERLGDYVGNVIAAGENANAGLPSDSVLEHPPGGRVLGTLPVSH